MQKYISQLDRILKDKFSKDSCHDIYHAYRVHNIALKIQQKEGGDKEVISAASFLHDMHRMMQRENGKFVHPRESLPLVKEILETVKFPDEKIDQVLHAIEYHEEYSFSKKGNKATDIETLIIQDADNLDAMGAIGIGRTFGYSALIGVPMWNPKIPFKRKYYSEDKHDPSTLHHFHSKLLKLKDSMNTPYAKKLALKRHKYMQEFVQRFMDEWYGKY